jgi:hypothetical protein
MKFFYIYPEMGFGSQLRINVVRQFFPYQQGIFRGNFGEAIGEFPGFEYPVISQQNALFLFFAWQVPVIGSAFGAILGVVFGAGIPHMPAPDAVAHHG